MLKKLYDLQFVQEVPARPAQAFERQCVPQVPISSGGTVFNPYHPLTVQRRMLVAHQVPSQGTPIFLPKMGTNIAGKTLSWGVFPADPAFGGTLTPSIDFWPVIDADARQYDVDQQANDWGIRASDLPLIGDDVVIGEHGGSTITGSEAAYFPVNYNVALGGLTHLVNGARHIGLPLGLMPYLYHGQPLWSPNFSGATFAYDEMGNALSPGTDKYGQKILCFVKPDVRYANLAFMAFQDMKKRLFVASVIDRSSLESSDPLAVHWPDGGNDPLGYWQNSNQLIYVLFPARIETWDEMPEAAIEAKILNDDMVMAFSLDALIYP